MSRLIRIGHITIGRLPPKDVGVRANSDAAPYLCAVEELGRVLTPDTWALAGGLVIPLSVGRFYRKHSDIDIVMRTLAPGGTASLVRPRAWPIAPSSTLRRRRAAPPRPCSSDDPTGP